jgi:excisionase family DNA binding protein
MTQWLRVREACHLLNISPSTLARWRQDGLPHSLVGGILFFDRDDLDRWVRQHRARMILRRHGMAS